MEGEVYRLPPRGKGQKQKRRRYAVVVQPDWPHSARGSSPSPAPAHVRPASGRQPSSPDRQTLVMCDQFAAVDLNHLTEPVGFLTIEEMQRVDEALALVLDL